jgi:5-hydroxyisourate hydrolase
MSKITTHVLDTVPGKPAAGVSVRLEKRDSDGWAEITTHPAGTESPRTDHLEDVPGAWSELSRSATDADGRCRDLAADAPPGDYRITFDTGAYFKHLGRSSIYPEIAITFTCDGSGHYHLPLLISDNSYTTYRGS